MVNCNLDYEIEINSQKKNKKNYEVSLLTKVILNSEIKKKKINKTDIQFNKKIKKIQSTFHKQPNIKK